MSSQGLIGITLLMIGLLVFLAVFVLFSSVNKFIKTAFTLLCTFMSVWIVANTLADTAPDQALFWTRLAFSAAALTVGALFIFVLYFPRRFQSSTLISTFTLVIGLAVALLSVSSVIVRSITIQSGYANVNDGVLYGLYVVYIVSMLVASLLVLLYRLRTETDINKDRVLYVLLGTAITAFIAVMTNLIIPSITGTNPLAIYGSFAVVAFIAMVTFAIVRHSLFSIRVATARAVAYLLSGVSLGLFFIVVIFGLSELLNIGTGLGTSERLFFAFFAVLVGFMFPAIKRFFDKLTASVLLRDTYDSEEVLKRITSVVTQSRDIKLLLRGVSKELQDNLRLSLVEYSVYGHDNDVKVSHTSHEQQHTQNAVRELIASRGGVLITLTGDDFEAIRRDDIGMILVLKTTHGVQGYLAIGYKRNGTTFSANEKSLLESVANEVAIATENYIRFEEIEKFNETLQKNIDSATNQLRTSNKKLRDLDETKDEFISMASHQLRTPLTSVKGYISMLLDGDMGELKPAQRQVLEEAYGSSQRMVYLIGDFLNLSRLRTGKFVIERAPVLLSRIIEQEISQLQEAAKHKNIELRYETPAVFPKLMLDETKIRQVMMNFIDNAIYYSKPDGGKVTISLVKHANHVTFRVTDSGIGVPKDARKKLFTKFYRAENARRARPDGTGVGLFMAKKVVVAHGGAILFESKEDQGSTFGMRIPLDELNTVSNKQANESSNNKN